MRPALPLLLLACVLLPGCDQGGAPEPSNVAAAEPSPSAAAGAVDRSRAGKAAPAASFEDGEGQATSLADFAGTPVLVNLWATWCAPCVAELPTLDALAKREEGKLRVLAVSQDSSGRAKVESFLEERGIANLEAHLDPELALMTGLEVATLPTTILYDAKGREVWRVAGDLDWSGEKAAALIKEADAA